MLVYRHSKTDLGVRRRLNALVERAGRQRIDLDEATGLLIEFGELETGIADALEPDTDSNGRMLAQLRQVALTSGRLLHNVWRGRGSQEQVLVQLRGQLVEFGMLPLPEIVRIGVPEGYAYYALYPQMYLESAERFFDERRPQRATVIGLRNIGSSLSATVAGTLQELGVSVDLYTVRPHGHPFDRQVTLSPDLAQEWKQKSDRFWLIVDEGPGLSGSSLTAAAEAIARLGIPDEQIILFPSWQPDGSEFLSSRAREIWGRHAKYSTGFAEVWVDSGRFAQSLPPGKLTDISSGKWRELVLRDPSTYPPVQPQHERVKYLFEPDNQRDPPLLLKFAGLGYYGQAIRERAEVLASGGFGPRVDSLTHGFLAAEFAAARVATSPKITDKFLNRIAEYMAFVSRQFPAEAQATFDDLAEMMQVNVRESLGEEWWEKLNVARFRKRVNSTGAVNLDARMFPHEWLETPTGWIKTDGLEHHDDHFYPGPQDIAWDLASVCIEFRLEQAAESYLLRRYCILTQDKVQDRIRFYKIAYLAFRVGYTTMAHQSLGPSNDGLRFERAKHRYARLGQQAIAATMEWT